MIRKILPYCFLVFKLDLTLSFLATFITATLIHKVITFNLLIYFFMLSFLTGGFLLGILYFEFARNREYYFYYNLGISKLRLILTSYLFHLFIAIPILIIVVYAR